MKWKTVSDNLLNMSNALESYIDRYNETTIEAFGIFRDAMAKLVRSQVKVRFFYYYITLGTEVHPNVEGQASELKNIIKKYYPSSEVKVIFVTADQLMDMYNTDSEIRVNLDLADQPISLSENEYISLVKLGTYFNFITDENNNLRKSFFEANVRDYQGHNSVNSSIADTLEGSGNEDFWWLNNGVSYVDDTLIFQMALFANNKDSDKISEIIHRTEVALADMMGGLNIKFIFDIYSLSPKNSATENKVLRNLLSIKGNEQKEEFYKNNITYHWYNRKNTLFSGVDLDK